MTGLFNFLFFLVYKPAVNVLISRGDKFSMSENLVEWPQPECPPTKS